MERKIDTTELIKLLIVFVLEIGITVLVSNGIPALGMNTPTYIRVLLLDIALIVPTVIYTFVKGDTLAAYGFRRIKIGTFFLTILLTFVSMPMYWFANVLSQLFVPNVIVQNMDNLLGDTLTLSFLAIAVIAPISEEIIMRGFFQNRFKNIMPFTAAAVLSGFLFGVLHMNLNQFCYAWVIGIVFAYTNRASGSILTSIIMHIVINGSNVGVVLLVKAALESVGMDYAEMAETARTNGQSIITNLIIFGVLSVASFFLSRIIIRAIAKREGTCEKEIEITTVEA